MPDAGGDDGEIEINKILKKFQRIAWQPMDEAQRLKEWDKYEFLVNKLPHEAKYDITYPLGQMSDCCPSFLGSVFLDSFCQPITKNLCVDRKPCFLCKCSKMYAYIFFRTQ